MHQIVDSPLFLIYFSGSDSIFFVQTMEEVQADLISAHIRSVCLSPGWSFAVGCLPGQCSSNTGSGSEKHLCESFACFIKDIYKSLFGPSLFILKLLNSAQISSKADAKSELETLAAFSVLS